MVPVEGVEGVYKVAFESLWEIVSRRWGIVSLSAIYTMEISLREFVAAVGKHDVLLKESAADICSKLASLFEEFERFVDGESVW